MERPSREWGDINLDGIPDIVVGAPGDDDGGLDRGALWVLFMRADGRVGSHQKISSTIGGLTEAIGDGEGFGSSVALIRDIDDDGASDVAVGLPGGDDGGTDRGEVWIVSLSTTGTATGETVISDSAGNLTATLSDGDRFGASIAGIGDVNGDGRGDLAVGAPGDDDGGTDTGSIYLLFLAADETVGSKVLLSDTSGGTAGLIQTGSEFGAGVYSPGDLNKDGVFDLVVGAPGYDDLTHVDSGAIHTLILSSAGGVLERTLMSADVDIAPIDLSAGDRFGSSVGGLGVFDGRDDITDIVVGAPGDDDGASGAGAAWIVLLGEDVTVGTDLAVDLTRGGSGESGGLATWTLVVGNLGGLQEPGGITLSGALDVGLALVSAVGTDWTCSTSALSFECTFSAAIDTGEVTDELVITTTITAPAGAVVGLTGVVTGAGIDPYSVNGNITVRLPSVS